MIGGENSQHIPSESGSSDIEAPKVSLERCTGLNSKEDYEAIFFPELESPESPTYIPEVNESELQRFRKTQFDKDEILQSKYKTLRVYERYPYDKEPKGFEEEDIPTGGAHVLEGNPYLVYKPFVAAADIHKSHNRLPVYVIPKVVLPQDTLEAFYPNISLAEPSMRNKATARTEITLVGSLTRAATDRVGNDWSSVTSDTYAVRGVYITSRDVRNREIRIHESYLSQEEIEVLGKVSGSRDLAFVNDQFEGLSKTIKEKLGSIEEHPEADIQVA